MNIFSKTIFVCSVLLSTLVSPTLVVAQNERIWIPGWRATESLSTPRAGSAILEVNGVIYAIGGIDGKDFLATTEYSRIQDNGHLSPWQPSSALTQPRGFFDAVAHNGYIYAVGGGNGPSGHNLLRDIERAKILQDGSLGPWQREKNTLNLPRRCVKLILHNQRIYAFGGFGGSLLDTIESAPILEDGQLGTWRVESNTLQLPRYVHAGKKNQNAIIVAGGHKENQGAGLKEVEWASLNSDTFTWQPGPSLNTGRYGHNAITLGNYMYVLGGLEKINYLRSIEKAPIDPTSGEPGSWLVTNPLSVALANFGVITYKDTIYILGGTNQDGYYNNVEFTSINQRGDVGFWGNKKQAGAYERWEKPQRQATRELSLEHYGVVIEAIDAGGYAYLHVEGIHGSEWLAAPAGHYPINTEVEYSTGIMMHRFHSDTLNRTFEKIRFISKINTLSSGHGNVGHSH